MSWTVKQGVALIALFLLLASAIPARADDAAPPFFDWNYSATAIIQQLFPFTSPYAGKNSILSRSETETTQTELISLRFHPLSNLKLQIDYQSARGLGVGNANSTGLAGYLNGQVIRISKVGTAPYFARYFLEWTQPAGPNSNVTVDFGKMAVPDIFDTNRYADSVDTQFLNWGLIDNLAYDYAADTRGYSGGLAAQWIHPDWILKTGIFQMPTYANGPVLSTNWENARGDQIELDRMVEDPSDPAVIRFLVYENHAHMGNYEDSLELAADDGIAPNIVDTEKYGAIKYGFGLNFEQPLFDDGDTGIFGRWGWNDDHTESFAYTEAGEAFSLGGQVSGTRWKLPGDTLGVAWEESALSYFHREYLAAGGYGFQLGDGKLDYGPESVIETYYSHPVAKTVILSLDYQLIRNPGYNHARGPVSVIGFRLHLFGK